MVKSILNPTVNYPEIKTLDNEDKNFDATQYEYSILGVDVVIALGQSNYSFIDEDIIYYPVYLIKDDSFFQQIGVFEILESELPNIIDDEQDIDLDLVTKPLLYSSVNEDLLKTSLNEELIKSNEEIIDPEEVEIIEDDGEDDGEDEDIIEQVSLPIQDSNEMEQELLDFDKSNTNDWIEEYLKSNSYKINDNDGGGDCLFLVIKEALDSLGKDVTVLELRNKISNEITPEIYANYKEHYDMIFTSLQEQDIKIKKLNKLNNELRDRLKYSKDRSEQIEIVKQAKEVSNQYKRTKSEIKIQKELLNEFKIMKKVKSLEDFKKVIKTCEFWADDWAISTLERILNVKLILFSSQAWEQGDKSNVLLCGQNHDEILNKAGKFEPQYYILVDYTGIHYKLITYKSHKIFDFSQIPYKIKLLISETCLRGESGIYKIIPQFNKFNKDIGVIEPTDIEVIEDVNTLYDPNIVFQYYIRSNKKPLPGKGKGEKIPFGKEVNFSKLAEHDNWRKKLDNEFPSEIKINDKHWYSVEHYIEACKFKDTNPDFFFMFTLESKSKISKDIVLAKAAGSNSGKYKGDLLRSKNISIDPSYFGEKDYQALDTALTAKFSQIPEMNQILIDTQNAKLMHFQGSAPAKQSDVLMLVRNKLKK